MAFFAKKPVCPPMKSFAASQVFPRPGMRAALALRRLRGEEGFKKIVFLYERSRYLYENKEGHVKNEAKTKLKTRRFLAEIATKNAKSGRFLAKEGVSHQPSASRCQRAHSNSKPLFAHG